MEPLSEERWEGSVPISICALKLKKVPITTSKSVGWIKGTGLLHSKVRNSLSYQSVEALMFIRMNAIPLGVTSFWPHFTMGASANPVSSSFFCAHLQSLVERLLVNRLTKKNWLVNLVKSAFATEELRTKSAFATPDLGTKTAFGSKRRLWAKKGVWSQYKKNHIPSMRQGRMW